MKNIDNLDKVREKVDAFLNPLGYSAKVEKSIGDVLYIIEPSTRKVGNKRSDYFDGMQILAMDNGTFEVSEYQAGENENELYIYKETNSLTNALKDLIKGNKRKPIKKYKDGGGVDGWEDLSNVKPNSIEISETSAFGNPDKLILKYNGKQIAKFYYNMRGYNSDFSLKNSEGLYYGFSGDKPKSKQVSDFKKALKEGFTFIKGSKYKDGGGVGEKVWQVIYYGEKHLKQRGSSKGSYKTWVVANSREEAIDKVKSDDDEFAELKSAKPTTLDVERHKFAKGGGVKKKGLMSMAHLVIADMRAEKIKDWYTKNHPTDDLGEELHDDVTFADLMNALNNKKEIYEVMGVGDSVIRERLFERLTWMYDESYDTIYNKWLDSDDYAQGGATKGFNYSIGGL